MADLYWCIRCQCHYPAASFASSSLKRGVRRCSKCRSQDVKRQRERSPESIAAHCLYELERRRYGHQGGLFPIELVKRVLDKYKRRSVISGCTEKLRLRRFWPDLPFSEWNSIVVTAGENKVLGHAPEWMDYFSAAFVAEMRAKRAEH